MWNFSTSNIAIRIGTFLWRFAVGALLDSLWRAFSIRQAITDICQQWLWQKRDHRWTAKPVIGPDWSPWSTHLRWKDSSTWWNNLCKQDHALNENKYTRKINITKGIANFMPNNDFLKNTTRKNKKSKHINHYKSQESNLWHLAPQFDALPLYHRDNCTFWLKSSYLTVST